MNGFWRWFTKRDILWPLYRLAKTKGSLIATQSSDKTISYAEYHHLVEKTAQQLTGHKIVKGDRVMICLDNSWELAVMIFALIRVGAIAVPVSTRYPFDLVHTLYEHIGAKCLITADESRTHDKLAMIHFSQVISNDIVKTNFLTKHSISLGQPVTIIFTSGSSAALPKGALHSFGNHHYNALGSNENIPFTAGDRWLLSLPLYHVGGLAILFRALINGGTVVIPEKNEALPDAIQRYRPTHLSLVATQLHRLLKGNETFLQNTKAILLGGSAIPEPLIRQAYDKGLPIYVSYGSTEMGSQTTTTCSRDGTERLLTAGKLLRYRELKIDATGEIHVRGKTRFMGYVDKSGIVTPFDANGWFATKDCGYLDSDGYLHVTGRKDLMFISGGENIQPQEIEQLILQLTEIEKVIVVPVPHPEFDFRPFAFILCDNLESELIDKIKNYLTDKLPPFKIPDYFCPFPTEIGSTGIKDNREKLKALALNIVTKT